MARKHGKSFALDKMGQRFGRLTVVGREPNLEYFSPSEKRMKKRAVWLCRCDCGGEIKLQSYTLTTKNTVSCGCFKKEVVSEMNKLKANLDGQTSINSLFARYKNDAKKRSLTFDLTKDQFSFFIKQDCEYCGVSPYQVHISHAKVGLTYNGIDRVNPKLGYSILNSVPCCGRCNLMKLDMQKENFIDICRRIVLKSEGKTQYKEIVDTRPTSKQRHQKKSN